MKRRTIFALLGLAAALPLGSLAQAPWPERPVTIVVPFTPGGGGDTIIRMLAPPLGDALGKPIVMDNKPGAGGSLGTKIAAAAKADGYTLVNGTSSTHAINPWLYSKLGYDVLKDFEAVAILATSDYAIAVPAASPAKSIADLLAMNKKSRLQYASSGNGTTSHLAAVLFAKQAGTDFDHVPYKGSGQALTDLMGERVSFFIDNTSVLLPHAKSGKIRILATSGAKRSSAAPEIPTMIEAGVTGYEVIGWWGVFAPAGTPKPVLERLNDEIHKAMASQAITTRLVAMGNMPAPALKLPETRAFVKSEYEKFGKVVKAAGVTLD